MRSLQSFSKTFVAVLLCSLLFASCDIPDISQFTEQSAEMTRGIRRGVGDTELVIKTAAQREDLYSDKTRAGLKRELKRYQKSLRPTLDALDGLDGYLGALNALADANEKSEENSRAVVNSISGLVTAVTGFAFASEVLNVGTGLLTVVEQIRTARSFKKRVNLAAEIVEGRYIEKTEVVIVNNESKERKILVKTCNENANEQIVRLSKIVKDIVDPVLDALTPAEAEALADLSPKDKRAKLHEWNRLSDEKLKVIEAAEATIGAFGCGVVDFLKFSVVDLKEINLAVSESMYSNLKDKHQTVTDFNARLNARRGDIRRAQARIQTIQNLITELSEYTAIYLSKAGISNAEKEKAENETLRRKLSLKRQFDDLFTLDPASRASVIKAVSDCTPTGCGKMLDVLTYRWAVNCTSACEDDVRADFANYISMDQWDQSVAVILGKLIPRSSELDNEDRVLAARVAQLKPDYDAAVAEMRAVKDKEYQLDSLHAASLKALDAWAESHANLRVAVNNKQALSVAKLASKVREIWGIIDGTAE